MSFLADYAALGQRFTDPAERAHAQAGLLTDWLTNRAQSLFAELRTAQPIFLAPGIAVAVRRDDVLEILGTDRVFSVKPYARRMARTTGDFILGMARTGQYDREASALRLAADRDDLPRVAAIVADAAAGLLRAARGRVNIADGFARRAALRVVADYFGTPGPDEATLGRWLRILFRDIFLNLPDDPAVRQGADAAAAEMKAYLADLVAQRRAAAAETPPADVIGRLAGLQADGRPLLDADTVRRCIGGVVVGAADTVNKAFVQAIDELLNRPAELAQAQAAAARGDGDAVLAYVLEAMRFRPQNPFLYRLCEADYVLARGTSRATTIPAGTLVFAATAAAMADPTAMSEPDAFRPGRPPEDYLFFGHALHTCYGQFVAPIEFRELGLALLRLKNLRRAAGLDGQAQYDGPFPTSLWLEYDA